MKNIVLIGMMGSGKTTVGGLLAQRLDRPLADTDVIIEERQGRSIPDIFASDGEDGFRTLELEMSRELSTQQGLVVACGGGLPLREDAIAALKENGIVFWLNRDPERTYDSLDVSGRPNAQNGRAGFLKRYLDRIPVYSRWADHIVPCECGPEEVSRAISKLYAEDVEAMEA